MVSVVIHANPGLKNQQECARWLSEGMARHGIKNTITADKHAGADIHIIQGPWYCYNEWLAKSATERVLFLNRCFYGHSRFDVSLGWLRPDGSRDFLNHGRPAAKGILPTQRPRKDTRRSAVIFADYGIDPAPLVSEYRLKHKGSLYFRPHPQQPRETKAITLNCDLEAIWGLCDVAIGGFSTVLVEAAIAGLHVETTDPLHVVNGYQEPGWLTDLSWANWSHTELKNGDWWEHLCKRAD